MPDIHDALAQAYARIAPELARRRAQRAELRQSGWSALRLARTVGYTVEKCRESGSYYIAVVTHRDPALLAAGWRWDGYVYTLEGR